MAVSYTHLLSAERLGVPVFEYTPMQVKQAVAGYGGADKRQVMLMTDVYKRQTQPET